MLKKLLPLLLILSSLSTHAYEFDLKAFLVLDLLTLQKLEGSNQSAEMGYGTADIKFYFRKDAWTAKFKLDIDASAEEGTSIDLMEEALLSYKIKKDWKITFGKGKVPFYQMHFGVTERHLLDGGYLTNTRSSFRAGYFKRKYLATVRYGGWKKGHMHDFTFFGSNQEVRRSRDDETFPDLGGDPAAELEYSSERTFNTKFQRGASYKGKLIFAEEHEVSFGAFSYFRDLDPANDYGFSLAYEYENDRHNIWSELLYGNLSQHPNDRYTSLEQQTSMAQIGYLYKINDKWNIGLNLEYALVDDQAHNAVDYVPDYGQSPYNDGKKEKTTIYKADLGVQYKIAPRVVLNSGILLERQESEKEGTSTDGNPSAIDGYGLNFSLTTWL